MPGLPKIRIVKDKKIAGLEGYRIHSGLLQKAHRLYCIARAQLQRSLSLTPLETFNRWLQGWGFGIVCCGVWRLGNPWIFRMD